MSLQPFRPRCWRAFNRAINRMTRRCSNAFDKGRIHELVYRSAGVFRASGHLLIHTRIRKTTRHQVALIVVIASHKWRVIWRRWPFSRTISSSAKHTRPTTCLVLLDAVQSRLYWAFSWR